MIECSMALTRSLTKRKRKADMDELLVERDGNVEIITLNRPEVLNALTYGMVKGLGDLLEEAQVDDSIRAVVITGAGEKAFQHRG